MQLNFKYFSKSLIIISLFFSSCETDFDPTIFVPPAKPFVTCYLTNTKSQILLYYRTPISVNDTGWYGNVTNASIFLEDGLITQQMYYDTSHKVYKLDTNLLPIVKGHTYELNIMNADGTEMHATTSIPYYEPPVFDYNASRNGSDFHYSFSFSDSSMQEKYFLFQLLITTKCTTTGCNDTNIYVLKSIPIYKAPEQTQIQKTINFSIGYDITFYGTVYGQTIEAFAIDKDMFNYFNSVASNMPAQHFDGSNAYSSPSPIYSNFKSGNGILGPVMTE